jgi:uncharacterized protein YbjT (DUF2867 family)
MFVITGASGRVGGVAADALMAAGHPVRVIVRDARKGEPWRARGAEVAVCSIGDEAALARALEGAAGFFALLPDDAFEPEFPRERRRLSDAMVAATRASGVPHVVLLSAIAAPLSKVNCPALHLGRLEEALRAAHDRVTALRACYLQENVLAALPAAREQGVFPCFLPTADTPLSTVATRDVGRVAARCLLEPPARSEVVDLAGPAYTARQMAEKLGAALGRSLQVVEIPAAAHAEVLAQAGLPRPYAEAVAEFYAAVAAGLVTPRGERMLAGTTTLDETLAAALSAPGASRA